MHLKLVLVCTGNGLKMLSVRILLSVHVTNRFLLPVVCLIKASDVVLMVHLQIKHFIVMLLVRVTQDYFKGNRRQNLVLLCARLFGLASMWWSVVMRCNLRQCASFSRVRERTHLHQLTAFIYTH